MVALGCSDSGSSSEGGCGSGSQRCEINSTATVCGDRIMVECFDGATPEAMSQCDKALEEDGQVVYCCTNAAAPEPEGSGGGGAGGGAVT